MSEPNWLHFSLKTPDDWIPWYAIVKDQAITWGIWDYINPEVSLIALKDTPVELPFLIASRINLAIVDITELDDRELARYNALTRDYDRQIERLRHYQKATDKMKQGIRNSLSRDNQRLIISLSLRDVLRTL